MALSISKTPNGACTLILVQIYSHSKHRSLYLCLIYLVSRFGPVGYHLKRWNATESENEIEMAYSFAREDRVNMARKREWERGRESEREKKWVWDGNIQSKRLDRERASTNKVRVNHVQNFNTHTLIVKLIFRCVSLFNNFSL